MPLKQRNQTKQVLWLDVKVDLHYTSQIFLTGASLSNARAPLLGGDSYPSGGDAINIF